MSIRIDVIRGDGEVTRLVGESGIATCMGPLADKMEESSPPTISLRCGNEAELAWNAAVILAAVRHASPTAYEMAHQLMEYCNFDRPQINRRLP